MTKGVVAVIGVALLLAAALGLQVISYPGSKGRVVCVLTKEQLSFRDTLLSADSQMAFVVQHPLLSAQIASGRVNCLGR